MKQEKLKGVNIRLFLLPFLILFILFATISYISIKNHIKSTYAMVEQNSITIAQSYNRRITNSQKAAQIIKELLEDKFFALGDAVSKLDDCRSGQSLEELSHTFKVDEINLYDNEGQVICSSRPENIGLATEKNHPVSMILPSWSGVYFDDTTIPAENALYRYAYLKIDTDLSIGIGILIETYDSFLQQFTIEQLITDIMNSEDITNIFFTNNDYQLVASGIADYVGINFSAAEIHTHFLHDKPQVGSDIIGGSRTLHVCAPVFYRDEKIGTLTVVWPPEMINKEIKRILLDNAMRFLLVALVLAVVLYYAYRKNKASIAVAYYDKLTGLPNTEYLKEYVTQKARLLPQRKLAVLLFNCENFQLINLTYGFLYGDKILQQAAAGLGQLVQPGRMLFRLSGDRFVLVVTDYLSVAVLEQIAQAARQLFAQPDYLMHRHEYLTLKTAIYEQLDEKLTVDQVIHNATLGINAIKGSGQNSVIFTEQMQLIPRRNEIIENAIIGVIHSKSADFFSMVYQPLLCTRTGQIRGFEALARLRITGVGEVPPLEFIPLSEERNLIFSLGLIIFHEVCLFLQQLEQAGYPDMKVSVNLSGLQLLREDFIDTMQSVVDDTGTRWDRLVFELTESVLSDNYAIVNERLSRLKELGSSVALDDFGTGYSSYAELRKLNINSIKIDRTFIKEIEQYNESDLILDNIIALAHKLGLHTVAEGVETKNQFDYLHKHGCDLIQGFYFSRPLPEQEAIAFLKKFTNEKSD